MVLAEEQAAASKAGSRQFQQSAVQTGFAAERSWLVAGLVLALVFAAWTMAPAFGSGDVVQDDARSHVFWMERFRDPNVFPDYDLADYWQSLAQPGYSALYWLICRWIDPLLASKLIPPVLGVVSALFVFLFARCLHPSPVAAFLASALLSRYFWQYDDLASGSPRPFALPLLAIQVWALASGRTLIAVGAAVVAALFYPMAAVLGVSLLGVRLLDLNGGRPRLSRERPSWLAFGAAVLLVGGLLLQSQISSDRYGPMVSPAEAREMPEFGRAGRVPYFSDDPYRYWLRSNLSGFDLRAVDPLLPNVPVLAEYALGAALLPLLWLTRRRFSIAAKLTEQRAILSQLLVASAAMFLIAHLLLFRLYFPSRYVKWSVPLALAVAAGLALGILIEEFARRCWPNRGSVATGVLTVMVGLAILAYPGRFNPHFERDRHPLVTAYLREQPVDILIAGVPIDTDSIPTFTRRRVLTNRQNAYPMLLGFYLPVRARTEDLIQAYYSETTGPIVRFAERYGVELFLVNRAAFQPGRFGDAWGGTPGERWEPFTSEVGNILQRTRRFALLDSAAHCSEVDDGTVAAVPSRCLRDSG